MKSTFIWNCNIGFTAGIHPFVQHLTHRVIRRCAWQRSNFSILRRNSNHVKSLS